jgi:hypothetical protein
MQLAASFMIRASKKQFCDLCIEYDVMSTADLTVAQFVTGRIVFDIDVNETLLSSSLILKTKVDVTAWCHHSPLYARQFSKVTTSLGMRTSSPSAKKLVISHVSSSRHVRLMLSGDVYIMYAVADISMNIKVSNA